MLLCMQASNIEHGRHPLLPYNGRCPRLQAKDTSMAASEGNVETTFLTAHVDVRMYFTASYNHHILLAEILSCWHPSPWIVAECAWHVALDQSEAPPRGSSLFNRMCNLGSYIMPGRCDMQYLVVGSSLSTCEYTEPPGTAKAKIDNVWIW